MPTGADGDEKRLAVGGLVFQQLAQERGVGDVGELLFRRCSRFRSNSSERRFRKSIPKINSLNSEASILPRKMSAALKRKFSSWERVIFSRFILECTHDNPHRPLAVDFLSELKALLQCESLLTVDAEFAGNHCDFLFRVRWLRFFLPLVSFVRPSTPPLSHRVLRHFFEAQSFGCGTCGSHTNPQTSQNATRCILQPMSGLYILPTAHNALDFRSAPVYNMSCRHYVNGS